MTPEIVHIQSSDDKVEPSSEISPDLPVNDEPKSSNKEVTRQPEASPSSLLTRAEREGRLRE